MTMSQYMQAIMIAHKQVPRTIVVPAMKDEKSWFTICSDKDEIFVEVGVGDNDDDDNDGHNKVTDIGVNTVDTVDGDDDDEYDEEDRNIGCGDEKEMGATTNLLSEENKILLEKKRVELEASEVHRAVSDESNENRAILESPFLTLQEWNNPMNPSMTLVLQFDSVLTQKLLSFNVSWVERQNFISNSRCLWIYALLARLETPLYQDTVAMLRQLYRKCCLLRSQVVWAESQTGEQSEVLKRINLLVILSGSYYGQGDDYRTRL